MNLKIYTDGAARGNPGPAGIGIVIYDENGKTLEEYSEFLGTTTNNEAEYRALCTGLKLAAKYIPCSVELFLDSELVVQQMLGNYKVKNLNLLQHFQNSQELLKNFSRVLISYIPREQNKTADRLANKAINLKKIDLSLNRE